MPPDLPASTAFGQSVPLNSFAFCLSPGFVSFSSSFLLSGVVSLPAEAMDWAALQRVALALTSAALCRTARGAPVQQSLP